MEFRSWNLSSTKYKDVIKYDDLKYKDISLSFVNIPVSLTVLEKS